MAVESFCMLQEQRAVAKNEIATSLIVANRATYVYKKNRKRLTLFWFLLIISLPLHRELLAILKTAKFDFFQGEIQGRRKNNFCRQ